MPIFQRTFTKDVQGERSLRHEIAVFQQSIETCEDPAEIARKVKRTFKRMPGEMALVRPKTVAALLERGVDPSRRNNLGLCWNDVARHVVRPEV